MPSVRTNPLAAVLSAGLVIALLYLGKAFLLPLTLSVLLAFLLAPVVARFEGWGLGRVLSVTVVTLLAFALIGAGIYVVAAQFVDLVDALPGYRENLRVKVLAPLEHVSSVFGEFSRSFQPAAEPAPAGGPLPVEVVSGKIAVLDIAREIAGPVLAPIGTAAVVIVNVVFFLFERQSLRDRFIHLVGRGRLRVTTQAMDDAAGRVSRYLGAQLIVNATYGIPIGIGLYFIGVPNAALWGLLAIVLRFIPYLGAWIAAVLPIALSVAISPSWTPPLAAIALFVCMELLSNNVVEPWLYGASTGLSPSAVIVSATFWTWLWGVGGLLLATPLTVCVVVLGKYVPALAFLDILLGDRPPIAPEHRVYQRLLAGDHSEVEEIISDHIERGAAMELFDDLLLPALHLAERDLRSGNLDPEELHEICRCLRDELEDLDGFGAANGEDVRGVVIIPTRTEAEALAGAMLAFVLRERGVICTQFSERMLASEIHARLVERPDAVVCLSALSSATARTAGSIFKRLASAASGPRVLGFWGGEKLVGEARMGQSGAVVVTRLHDAVSLITASAATPASAGESEAAA